MPSQGDYHEGKCGQHFSGFQLKLLNLFATMVTIALTRLQILFLPLIVTRWLVHSLGLNCVYYFVMCKMWHETSFEFGLYFHPNWLSLVCPYNLAINGKRKDGFKPFTRTLRRRENGFRQLILQETRSLLERTFMSQIFRKIIEIKWCFFSSCFPPF